MTTETITVDLQQQNGYRFLASYADGVPSLLCDEPPPLGEGAGPSPVQLLATAVGNCLSDSLLFALRKFKQQPEPLSCRVTAQVGRNAEGRLRVTGMLAELTLGVEATRLEHLDRVLSQFEAFCTVTQSVAAAFPVEVRVRDAAGSQLK
ncbi:MAG TPA: OsmC family protein [Rhizobacter sp.]|nr:OsmC family protein [Rhizobacter sp.]